MMKERMAILVVSLLGTGCSTPTDADRVRRPPSRKGMAVLVVFLLGARCSTSMDADRKRWPPLRKGMAVVVDEEKEWRSS